ncbi:MAG TPA: hypothetical protein VFO07_07085 [Roseiflexaceae bacterium]|nr:hypothetical protein [Roseiflexaceae bacterium]
MEIAIALVLFIGLLVLWLILPGGVTLESTQTAADPLPLMTSQQA